MFAAALVVLHQHMFVDILKLYILGTFEQLQNQAVIFYALYFYTFNPRFVSLRLCFYFHMSFLRNRSLCKSPI